MSKRNNDVVTSVAKCLANYSMTPFQIPCTIQFRQHCVALKVTKQEGWWLLCFGNAPTRVIHKTFINFLNRLTLSLCFCYRIFLHQEKDNARKYCVGDHTCLLASKPRHRRTQSLEWKIRKRGDFANIYTTSPRGVDEDRIKRHVQIRDQNHTSPLWYSPQHYHQNPKYPHAPLLPNCCSSNVGCLRRRAVRAMSVPTPSNLHQFVGRENSTISTD